MIAIDIATLLNQHVKKQNLGRVFAAETGFRLATDPDPVRAPDAAFVRRARAEEAGRVKGYWPGAPDLAVEVIFPNDAYTEIEEEVAEWMEAGTRMVVVVNPRHRPVTVYRSRSDIAVLIEADTLEGGDVVPGWSVPGQDLFA